jgi:DNA-binding response OmpR family regulator
LRDNPEFRETQYNNEGKHLKKINGFLLFKQDCVHYIEFVVIMKRILFLNNRDIPTIIPRLLISAGFAVNVARDIEDGLQLANTNNFDMIIVVENAGAESWRLCEKIRRQTVKPLIVISTNASTETCVKAINAGADFFLRKPFGALELLARVNVLLQRTPRKVVSSIALN